MPEKQNSIGLGLRETKQRIVELLADSPKVEEERKKVEEERVTVTPDKLGDNYLKLVTLTGSVNSSALALTRVVHFNQRCL